MKREEQLLAQAYSNAQLLRRAGYNVWVYSHEDCRVITKQMLSMKAKNEFQCILYRPTAIGMILANLSLSYANWIGKYQRASQGRNTAESPSTTSFTTRNSPTY